MKRQLDILTAYAKARRRLQGAASIAISGISVRAAREAHHPLAVSSDVPTVAEFARNKTDSPG